MESENLINKVKEIPVQKFKTKFEFFKNYTDRLPKYTPKYTTFEYPDEVFSFLRFFVPMLQECVLKFRADFAKYDDIYYETMQTFIEFIHMDVDSLTLVSKKIKSEISQFIKVVDELTYFLMESFDVKFVIAEDTLEDFFADLDKIFELLQKKEFVYLFNENFFINLNELSEFMPEFKHRKLNLKSFKDVVAFFAVLREKYVGNYKLLTKEASYLIKVLKSLKAVLNLVSEASVDFIYKFQQ